MAADLNDEAQPARRRLPAARRRRQLIDVALETFARNGLEATTMDDIASAAGVTKPLLYQHFRSKRALFLELLGDVAEDLQEEITTAASGAPTPRLAVVAGFSAYFHYALEHESAFRLLFDRSVPHDGELDQALRRVEDTIADAVTPLIEADIDPAHQQLLAYAVVGMAEGASRSWLRSRLDAPGSTSPDESREEADRLAARIADLAWAGLRSIHRD
ncbi:MAG TPA: helix-turn-helix domain-containing protein [Acidimicrobiales bacterium]|nr:helix-turn-helix domain-containing protein [Acidimicrobiales bacterium]